MEDAYETVLRWPHTDANEVMVSGDFDQWSNSVRLAKDETGFTATVKIPWGTTAEYKFLVDGQWKTSDAPTKPDPSGNFVNNVVTAPPKPMSSVSSAISYVASGLGGTFQSLAGTDITDSGEPSELSVKMSTKDMATTANSTEPTLPEAPAATEATHIVPVLPVTDTANDLDAPLSTKAELAAPAVSFKAPERQDIATHASAPESEQTVVPAEPELVQPVPSEPELGTAPAVLELEEIAAPAVAAPDAERTATPEPNQSTATPPELQEVMHVAPQSEEAESPAVSKPGHSITPEPEPIVPPIAKDIEQITPAGLEPEKVDPPVDATPETSAHTPVSFSKTESSKGLANGNCAPVLPAPSASEPAVPTLAVDITETPVGPSHTTKPVAAPSKSDDKAQTNGNSLSTKDKHVFPSSEKSEGDGTSSKTGSLPARKKRQSIFGKVKKFFEHKN